MRLLIHLIKLFPSILFEFITCLLWTFKGLPPLVTVFGSARFNPPHPYAALAQEVGALLGRLHYGVLTGGGPGLMEAANKGAREAGALSLGCNVILPYEQKPNPYLDRVLTFRNFFIRKFMLMHFSRAFIVMPGGIGTLDEVTDAITLIQASKIPRFPVIFVQKKYWEGVRHWFDNTLKKEGAVSFQDFDFVYFVDFPSEIEAILKSAQFNT